MTFFLRLLLRHSIRIGYNFKAINKSFQVNNHLLNMKLVLKYNEVIKLYAGEMKYQKIVQFMSVEMGLKKETIQFTYTDQEGDQIYLGDDNDLQVLTDLTNNKSYVKIDVKGQLSTEVLKENTVFDVQSIKPTNNLEKQIQSQQQKKIDTKQQIEKSLDFRDQVDKKSQKKKKQSKKQSMIQKSHQNQKKVKKQSKKQNKVQVEIAQVDEIKKFTKLMTQTIIAIVDERIQKVGYCKNKKDSSKKVQEKKIQIVHEGFSCKFCLVNPIIGIRYECPKCLNFSICEECQQNYEHDHYMLKIKSIKQSENLKNKADKSINKNLKKIYDLIAPQIQKKQKQLQPRQVMNQKNLQNCKQLKLIFGGKPKNYKQFVEKHPNLQFNQLLSIYCIENNIKIEQGKEKYAEGLSKKMAKLNKVQPDQLANYVKKNIKINQNGLVENIKEKNNKVSKTQIEGFQWNQKKCDLCSENLVKQDDKSDPKNAEILAELQKTEIKSQAIQNKPVENKIQQKEIISMDLNKKLEPQNKRRYLRKQEIEIYDLMVQIFGEQRSEDYPDFIEKQFKKVKDHIIMLWSNNLSGIK